MPSHLRPSRTLCWLLVLILGTGAGLTACGDDDVTLTPRDGATATPDSTGTDATGGDAGTTPSEPTSVTPAPTATTGPTTTRGPTATPEATPGPDPTATPEPDPVLALAPDGLLVVDSLGSSTHVPFGASDADTIAAVTAVFGPPATQSAGTDECPNGQTGVADWPGLLRVEFGDLGFIAWFLPPGSPLTTLTGLGLGSTRAELEDAVVVEVFDSSLGVEFFSTSDEGMPGLGGLLAGASATAPIDALWAGTICAFR